MRDGKRDGVKWLHTIYKGDGIIKWMGFGNGKSEMWKWKAWDVQKESVRCAKGKREMCKRKTWDVEMESVRCAKGKKPNFVFYCLN